MASRKLVSIQDKLQAPQIRPAHLLDEESDSSTTELGEERRRRTRWILALIISFLIGFSLGVILHDHIVKLNPSGPVWKSFPLD
ncbi:MAG: hypothetical protein WBW16_06150 [Bacteroidota bacterium]